MSACGNYAITELSPIKAFMFEAKVASVSSQIKGNSIIKNMLQSSVLFRRIWRGWSLNGCQEYLINDLFEIKRSNLSLFSFGAINR